MVGILLARESPTGGQPAGGRSTGLFLDWLNANVAGPRQPGRPARRPVTLVEIDDGVADTPKRLPLPALEYASFLHSVAKYDPAVVAIVPALDWPQSPPGTEQILLDEAITLPKLLLGVRLGSSAGNGRDPATLPAVENFRGPTARLADFPEIVETPGARLFALATATGATNLPGADGVPLRDLPLLFRCRERVVPGFTLETLVLALRLAPSEVSVQTGSHVQLGDRLRLPIDAAGRALLDPRAFNRVGRLSLDDLPLLVVNQATPEARAVAARMRGGVVILGRTDHAARTLRQPDGRMLSPAEAFAWAAASLEEAPATRRASAWWGRRDHRGFRRVGRPGARPTAACGGPIDGRGAPGVRAAGAGRLRGRPALAAVRAAAGIVALDCRVGLPAARTARGWRITEPVPAFIAALVNGQAMVYALVA